VNQRRIITPGQKEAVDISALMRALIHLDQSLKQGIVIGIYEDSMDVSDEDITKALTGVRREIELTANALSKLATVITQGGPFASTLQ
jgi:hypothetical protein